MKFDPANVLLGAVVILLATILIGAVFAVVFATWDRRTRAGEDWLIRDLDELHSRLEAMALEIARLDGQVGRLEKLERVHVEVLQLREENDRLQQEREELLGAVARIAKMLERLRP